MSDRFDDYFASTLAGMREGVGDVGRSAIADIGDSYQEVLLGNASISPADGLTGTMETVTTEADIGPAYVDASYTDVTPAELPALSPPDADIDIA
jgi:hypothetical protein